MATYLEMSPVDARNVRTDVGGGLLKRRGRVQVEIFEGEEVEDAGNVAQDILAESLVEGEGFQAG